MKKGRPKFKFPEVIDWSKTLDEIARDLKVTKTQVQSEWQRRNPGLRKFHITIPFPLKPSWQKYKAWDWTKSDSALGREHKCSRQHVQNIRKQLGLPSSRQRILKPLVV